MNVRSIVKGKLSQDLLWSLFAFVLLGITGILINFIIGRFYGPDDLGVFNQVFALYIVVSQFAVFGLRFSALKYISEYTDDSSLLDVVTSTVIYLVFISATLFTLVGFLSKEIITLLFDSNAVTTGWLYALPGLWFFAINKVLFAILNGHRDMRGHACFQIFRYSCMLATLLLCVMLQMKGEQLSLLLTIPEFFLFLMLFCYAKKYFNFVPFYRAYGWLQTHLVFGMRSMLSGTIAELNTKVDVLMLGYFCTDGNVGVYSMAALLAEGISQLGVVLRDNLNPLISKYSSQGEHGRLTTLLTKSRNRFYFIMSTIFFLSALCYPYLIAFITGGDQFSESWQIFMILAVGISLGSGYIPINMILVQLGKPGTHTMYKAMIVMTNIILNYFLVPRYGVYGAALGTAISFALSPLPLIFLVKKNYGLSI